MRSHPSMLAAPALRPSLMMLATAICLLASPARAQVAGTDTSPAGAARIDTSLSARTRRAAEKFRIGHTLEMNHAPAAAIAAYRQVVQLDPSFPEANYRMGMLYLTVNEVRPAAQCFLEEVRFHPEHHDARRELGMALARAGDWLAAVEQLERLTLNHPGNAADWAALAFAFMSARRAAAADSAMSRAIELKPMVASYHRDRGVALAALGRDSAARREYRRAIELAPRDATPWINLGNLERRERRLDAALANYRAAAVRDPASPLALEGQVAVLRDLGRDSEAGAIYQRWLIRKPDDHNARLDAVRLYGEIGRPDIALEVARRGVRAGASSPDARLVLGIALQESGDWRGGLAELRRAEGLFTRDDDRARAAAMIAAMRAQVPDSLRDWFAADSAAHPPAAPARPGAAR